MKKKTICIALCFVMAFFAVETVSVAATEGAKSGKTAEKVFLEVVVDAENIPSTFAKEARDINLVNVTVQYSNNKEAKMTSLDEYDGVGTWQKVDFDDVTDSKGNVTRVMTFKFYDKKPVENAVPVITQTKEIEFKGKEAKSLKSSSKTDFKVTREKNWKLLELQPEEDGTYSLSEKENDKVTLLLERKGKAEKHKINDSFELKGGKEYTVLVKYDLTD